MPTINENLLPATTGLALGNTNQQWIAYLSNAFAGTIQSLTSNPALTGIIRLASTDTIAWRNNANTADVTLSKTGAAVTTTPADTLVFTGGGFEGPFISHIASPAGSGELRLATADSISWRNQANTADIVGISKNASDQIVVLNPVLNNPTLTNVAAITVIPPTPVFTNTQMNECLVSEVNGLTPNEYNTVQAGNFSTDAMAGCVDMPITATVHQINGMAGYVTNHVNVPQSGGAVGGYFQGRQIASNGSSWGANSLVQDTVGLTGHQIISNEVDVNVLGVPARAFGVLVTGASTGTVPALGSAAGIEIRSPGYVGGSVLHWPAALNIPDGSGTLAVNIGTTTTANSVGSMPITLNGRDGGAVAHSSTISCDLNGRLQVNSLNVPVETAVVDLTAQTAAVGTTTLYTVPALGQGQYRISWNAKVTTAAGVSSTLGALTIVYTDPDGVAQTITCGAQTSAGAIATTSATNTTAAVLLGIPMLLNCKLSTVISYAMAYASNAANAMNYNLHIRLESL
jgi:hypothetical protein